MQIQDLPVRTLHLDVLNEISASESEPTSPFVIQALELQSTDDLILQLRIHVGWFSAGGAGWGSGSVKRREILRPIHNSYPTVIADEVTVSTGPKWRKTVVFADWTLEFF
jgi:hypothetical protein